MKPSVTRHEALKYALPLLQHCQLGPAWRPRRLLDFATVLVQPEQIKSAGYDGALVYVSELRPGATFDFKPSRRK